MDVGRLCSRVSYFSSRKIRRERQHPKMNQKNKLFWLFAQSNFDSSPYVNFLPPSLSPFLPLLLCFVQQTKINFLFKDGTAKKFDVKKIMEYRQSPSQFLLWDINFLPSRVLFISSSVSNSSRWENSSSFISHKYFYIVILEPNNRLMVLELATRWSRACSKRDNLLLWTSAIEGNKRFR